MSGGFDVEALRRRFPVTGELVYLNHAAIAPMPAESVAAMAELARREAVSGERTWQARDDGVQRVRGLAARLLGARGDHEVAFVGNTSEGLSVVAAGLDWRSGDKVVGTEPEFPTNVYPWLALAERGVEYRRIPERPDGGGRIDPDEVADAVDARTRVVAVSWVQYASGYRIDLAPLAAACRRHDALLVVDAIQGLGALALDVEAAGIDVCATGSHKWLLGPEGVGILYVSDRVIERLRPIRHGWRSVAGWRGWGPIDPTPAKGAMRFEAGTLNVYGIHALGASLALLLGLGTGEVERRVLALAAYAARGLAARGFELAAPRRAGEVSGIVAGRPPGGGEEAARLSEALAGRGIVVSPRQGRLRISPHAYNTAEEIDRLFEVLDEVG